MNFIDIAKNAKIASLEIAGINTELKNAVLNKIAANFEKFKEEIFEANRLDLDNAKTLLESGNLNQSVFNRLKFDENKMRDMISVASGFQYSVNIGYDLGSDDKLRNFIPTKSLICQKCFNIVDH